MNLRKMTIQQLEQHDFGDPAIAPTNMVRRCLELCRKPLELFSVEDLRLMIGQRFCLRHLIPLAIEQLKKDLFAEGDCYPGDLLSNVLSVNKAFWVDNRKLWSEVMELIKDRRQELADEDIVLELFETAFDKG